MSDFKPSKSYDSLIKEYTKNIKMAYEISKKEYKKKYVFDKIPLLEYSLAIAKKLNVYDENIIVSSILYNPYKYGLKLKPYGFSKNIRKICKDCYFLNFYELINNYDMDVKTIKNMIVQSFFKIESIIVLFGESLVILDYFPKIKDPTFKERFLDIVENAILPLSYQLGMQNVKEEILEQLMALKYKKDYNKICKFVSKKFPKENLEILKEIIIDHLKLKNHKPLKYAYRYKSPGSIYQKIYVTKHKKDIFEVLDIYALRLIYNTKKECYKALRIINNNFTVIEEQKIRDFIKEPKENGYQSIHLNILLDNYPLEIQIRTVDMHNNAEFGVSAHFHYKNIESSEKDSRLINILKQKTMVEKSRDKGYNDYILVYTITNQEMLIPKKSTILDFAFYLHTDFAKYFSYAEVNGKVIKNKSHILKNGDKIKIVRENRMNLSKKDLNNLFVTKNRRKLTNLLKDF